jgi:hypothetical protein
VEYGKFLTGKTGEYLAMTFGTLSAIERREFLKLVGSAAVCSLADPAIAETSGRVTVIVDSENATASSGPVRWAVSRLQKALSSKNVECKSVSSVNDAAGSSFCVAVSGHEGALSRGFGSGRELDTPESLRLAPGRVGSVPATLISASDVRGFVYGLLELGERVEHGANPVAALRVGEAAAEQPANEIRCVSRYFCSELEDKPWYYDKEFWSRYLDALAACRFNRFCLAYGLEYDFPRGVTDDYLHLPYPYLVQVPGYSQVKVMQLRSPEGKPLPAPVPLSDDERNRNYEALKYVASETAARGLQFQLGIWTHAYEWTASPNAYHHIDGLTPETHAQYCRDALAIILKDCPQIQGLTMRVHGESGIPEGSYPFWKTLFEAISGAGRKIDIDMHAKGVNQTMIDIGQATGMRVTLGAKYSAEHQSLGYNQADIRALEIPDPNRKDTGTFSLSGGSRLFTRYGYADFFEEGSPAKILYRLWPGTQRHLISADPEMAAAYGRTSHFCGALGIDLMEPLTFKGREGSGHTGGRCAYADTALNPKDDWEKFEYYYRVWGRKLYDPDCDLDVTRRVLKSQLGEATPHLEKALANSSRVLALITSAHLASASNHAFWPEIYDNMPIVLGSERSPYGDTPNPKCFGTVSPLDPQIFSTIVEHAQDLLTGRPNPKYSPIEVAQWLDGFATDSDAAVAKARTAAKDANSAEFRRLEEDALIQNGLGHFFAEKLRSGVFYEIFQQTGDAEAGKQALEHYKNARAAWAKMADRASRVYVADVSYGDVPMRRGHWSDRIVAIDTDLAAMEQKVQSPPAAPSSAEAAVKAVKAAIGPVEKPAVDCRHVPPESFHPGQPLPVTLQMAAESNLSARLYYRHVNQAERWVSAEMSKGHGGFQAAIPSDYTNSKFPLEYYFTLERPNEVAWIVPGFNTALSTQPYYAISKREA